MRCDEQRPRCSHCERLNLECKWRPPFSDSASKRQYPMGQNFSSNGQAQAMPNGLVRSPDSNGQRNLPNGELWMQSAGAVDQLFDYASFMWDGGDVWGQLSPEGAPINITPGNEWMVRLSRAWRCVVTGR